MQWHKKTASILAYIIYKDKSLHDSVLKSLLWIHQKLSTVIKFIVYKFTASIFIIAFNFRYFTVFRHLLLPYSIDFNCMSFQTTPIKLGNSFMIHGVTYVRKIPISSVDYFRVVFCVFIYIGIKVRKRKNVAIYICL